MNNLFNPFADMPDLPSGEQSIKRFAGETPWHRNWKKAFPLHYREKTFYDEQQAQLHRADVYTPCGTTLEFQNSPISYTELKSREAFYPKLIWVLNGKKFKGFRILKNLPDVNDPKLINYEFCQSDHLCMIRKSDLLSARLPLQKLNFYHPEIKDVKITSQYYSFCWKQPHAVWYEAKAPIVVDPGGHFLYQFKTRAQYSGEYRYLQLISRKEFVAQFV